jgi:hypothetical protein
VGELIAAVGVIVSLAYLAAQVRQNTKSIRSAANQDLLTSFNDVMEYTRQSAFGAHIYDVTIRGAWDELSPEEIPAARMGLLAVMRVFEQAYLQHKAGLLEDEIWEGWATQIQLSLGLPGIAQGWTAIRTMLNADFVAWMDRMEDDGKRIAAEYFERWAEIGLQRKLPSGTE